MSIPSKVGPHVAICLRRFPHTGGASQVLFALIRTLGELEGPERYSIIVQSSELVDWLTPHLGPNQEIVVHKHLGERGGAYHTSKDLSLTRLLKATLKPLGPATRYVQHLLAAPRHWPEVPVSDGFVESLSCDVVHFPQYWFMLCNVPSVYNPHDLQHRVYPQYIDQGELLMREVVFPAGCRLSQTVVVGTQWVKDDVVQQYAISPGKIRVIPWASPTQFFNESNPDELAAIGQKYQINEPFALLPANTWPHKNHLRLLDALALLRDRKGLRVQLVCIGARIAWYWPKIEARIRELNLESQVSFLGTVPDDDLRALYRLAQFLVMPTTYEADSNPIHEAWAEDLPVASSNVTALPDQVKDAGILFNPWDVEAMAEAVARMATDEGLRRELQQRGRIRRKDFSWERTAKAYRAVYRQAAQFPLTEEDRWLLEWDWLRDPQRVHEVRPVTKPARYDEDNTRVHSHF